LTIRRLTRHDGQDAYTHLLIYAIRTTTYDSRMDRLRRAKFEHDIPFDSFDYAPFDELRTSKTGSLRVVRDVELRRTKCESRATGKCFT